MWLDRINAWLLCALLVIAPATANASQGSLFSPTTGTVSGLQLTNNFNGALDAVNTCNSGATAPTNQLSGVPSLGNCWLNTTSNPNPLQWYDGAGWRAPFWIDTVNHYTDVKIGGGVATVASASTVDLCATSVAPQAVINITGSVTITSFGSTCNAGHIKVVQFAAALTLTYNATSLIIPGAANVLSSAGDQAVVYSLGSGNWQVLAYTPANGQALINPAIDLGTYVMTSAVSPPSSKYLLAFGQPISRATYAGLLGVVTITQNVSRTNGSPTLTGFSDTTQINAGAGIEGAGIPTGTAILSCTSTTCTMTQNASSSGTANATIFPYGAGDGSTTFNLPFCNGVTLAGRNNMGGTARSDSFALTSTFFGVNPNALGATGGGQSIALGAGNVPTINFSGTAVPSSSFQLAGNQAGFSDALSGSITGSHVPSTTTAWSAISSIPVTGASTNTGGSSPTPFRTIGPTLTANCMIRVLVMRALPSQHFAANDNIIEPVAIADRRRMAA